MRTDHESRVIAKHVVRTGDDKAAQKYSVKGPSCLAELSSIHILRSFPPDAMHIWWENVIPDVVRHWRGKYFSEIALAEIGAANYDADDESEEENTTKGRRGSNRATGKQKKAPATKFVKTGDPHNILSEEWAEIGSDMTSSAPTIPALFGDPVRDFTEHYHHLKAEEWKIFTFLLAPIYLKGRLPSVDYEEFINLVNAISLCCD